MPPPLTSRSTLSLAEGLAAVLHWLWCLQARSTDPSVVEGERQRFLQLLRLLPQGSLVMTDSQAIDVVHPWTQATVRQPASQPGRCRVGDDDDGDGLTVMGGWGVRMRGR